ncbi:ANR family transcriptional regulator (plasmid) [Serratia nevei]|uniref:ANR family transcriptional regulator n=1 Tax=Serratia nevei TaxID=2703794 RepID=UPI003F6C35C2
MGTDEIPKKESEVNAWPDECVWGGEVTHHLTVAREAAMLERAGDYSLARVRWLDACRLAVLALDRHWYESRALLCEKRRDAKADTH